MLIEHPYLIICEPAGAELVILTILHGRRRSTRELEREGD
jgi:plasmid stabilization system protein ParE